MKRSSRHRLKYLVIGIVCFVITWLLSTPCLDVYGQIECYLFWAIPIGANIPSFWQTYGTYGATNPWNSFTYAFGGTLIIAGIFSLIAAMKRPQLKAIFCSTCSKETQQFRTKRKWGDVRAKPAAKLEGYEYVCEYCGSKNFVGKACAQCGTSIPSGKDVCPSCGARFNLSFWGV